MLNTGYKVLHINIIREKENKYQAKSAYRRKIFRKYMQANGNRKHSATSHRADQPLKIETPT